ncbi:MAG: hypothetical protein EAZ74_04760, partial [Alphaproteobacteria bacterium]
MNDYLGKVSKVESGDNARAKSKTSSATGLYQTTKGTFAEMQKRYPWLAQATWEQHQSDPKLQQRVAKALTEFNEGEIKKHGHQVDDLTRYMYHFAGPTGANKLLTADPTAKVGDILGQRAAKANKELANLSVADLQNKFATKLGVSPPPTKEPSYLQGASAMMPWMMYRKGFAEGGGVKPWEQYKSEGASGAETAPKPEKKGFWNQVLSGTAKALNTRPEQVSGSLLDKGGLKIREKTPEEEKKGPTMAAKRAAHTLGTVQGGVADPIMAGMQMLPDKFGGDLANKQLKGYEDFRKELGGSGFDGSRLIGNVLSPIGLKGAQAVDKGFKAWGKSPSLVRQGATHGALAGALQPVINDSSLEGISVDEDEDQPGFWGEKAKQVGVGAGFGGVANKLLGPSASKFSNPKNLPATPQQLANQSKVPTDQVSQYRQMFPDADLTWGQSMGPRANQWEQRLSSTPFIGDVIRGAREKALRSQNVSMMNKALEPAGVKLNKGTQAGREMFDDAYTQLTSKYDDILDDVALHNPTQLRDKVYGTMKDGNYTPGVISDDYAKLSEAGKKQFDNLVEQGLFQKFGKDPQGNHSVRMTGRQFKNHEEGLKNTIDDYRQGIGEDRTIGRMLKNVLDETYQSLEGTTPQVTKQLKNLNKSYAQYKTLENASTASAQSGGVFNPLQTIKAATK